MARAIRGYRNTGAVRIPGQAALTQLIASGVSHRIDPERPVSVAAPRQGPGTAAADRRRRRRAASLTWAWLLGN
jgi:hypothetical protein